MGFIGAFITPIIGITEEDKKDAYYVIDQILFNSNKYHSGSCPIKSNIRLNINFVFEM